MPEAALGKPPAARWTAALRLAGQSSVGLGRRRQGKGRQGVLRYHGDPNRSRFPSEASGLDKSQKQAAAGTGVSVNQLSYAARIAIASAPGPIREGALARPLERHTRASKGH